MNQVYTIILFVGIRYSMRDLLFDTSNHALLAKRYASDTIGLNDVSASSGMSSIVLASCEFCVQTIS